MYQPLSLAFTSAPHRSRRSKISKFHFLIAIIRGAEPLLLTQAGSTVRQSVTSVIQLLSIAFSKPPPYQPESKKLCHRGLMRAAAAACKNEREQEEKCYEKLIKHGCYVFWVHAIEPY
jgi:hypothetical protein